MKFDKIILFLFLTLSFTIISRFTSCSHVADLSDLPQVCFERDVLPVFLNNCALSGCHDGTGEPDQILTSYQNIIKEIEPGNADGSKIYKVITASSGEDRMPPDNPLSMDNRILIRLWIEQGAQPSVCPGGQLSEQPETY